MDTKIETKVSKNRLKKESLVSEYAAKAEKSHGMVFTNYQGLTHQQLEGFKNAVRPLQAEFVVAKNTLLLRALGNKVADEVKGNFVQPTGALFLEGDVIEPLKQLAQMVKDLGLPQIKFGIIEGKTVTGDDVIKLSKLPPLPVLQAQLLGQMQAPISGLHRALRWNLQNLVMTLNAIKDKKPAA